MFVQFNEVLKIKSGAGSFVPIDCPVCKMMLKKSDIHASYNDFKCCEECKFSFVDINQEKWKSGWRPTKTQVNRVLKKRAKLPSYIMRG